jgi:alanine racemase
MDYIMADVGDLSDVAVGDEVTLIGRDGMEEVRAEDLARTIGTIPYELTCALGRRVKRIYVDGPVPVEAPVAGVTAAIPSRSQ